MQTSVTTWTFLLSGRNQSKMTKLEVPFVHDQSTGNSTPLPGPPCRRVWCNPLPWLLLLVTVAVCVGLLCGGERNAQGRELAFGSAGNYPLRCVCRGDASTRGDAVPSSASVSPSESAILKALETMVNIDCTLRPLEDVVEDIARQLNIPLYFDRATLTDEGVALDQPLTLHLHGITGRSALHLIMSPVQLEWIIADEILNVTTAAKAGETLDTRVYDVSDLVAIRDGQGKAAVDFEPLVELLTGTIDPDSWEGQDGPGSVRELNTGGTYAVAVHQSQREHLQIVSLLAELRERRHSPAGVAHEKIPNRKREPRLKFSGLWAQSPDRFADRSLECGINLFRNRFVFEACR